ncbi:MAG: hypothetical protein EAY70_05845 [Sphingomonadales bacterium]|nr:MAG: hypothetical protein EAY70_05845 [Sphingomonadales bacterium]
MLAVGAALIVGWRQTQIQSRQIALQEQELKVSLLEERLGVYDKVHNFFSFTLMHGRPAIGDVERDYQIALIKARFLFSDELNYFLKDVWHRHCDFGLHNTMSKGDNNADEANRIENVRLAGEDMNWFLTEFGKLHSRFGEIRPVALPGAKQTS